MRQLHMELDTYKSEKESVETITPPLVPVVDTKLSLVNFLSTVVAEADVLGLSYENIYNPTNGQVPRGTTVRDMVDRAQQKSLEVFKPPEPYIEITLTRCSSYILRDLELPGESEEYVKPCKDFL